MKCTYINLDRATERRARIEDNFAAHRRDGWELERFSAIDIRYIEQHQIKGSIRPAEKGCFVSHKHIIEANLDASAPFLIVEDDTVFGPSTVETIENFLTVSDKYDWDVIFTDVCIPNAGTMIDLIQLRHELAPIEQVRLLNLGDFLFAGSSSYLVNHRAVSKLAALMEEQGELNLPYDLFLRRMVYTKRLKGLVFFPFITSLSADSDASDIQQGASVDQVWNAFRKMVWVDRDLDAVRPGLAKIERELCDDESRLFATLFAALASKNCVLK
jgi:GR25 family glycosyltransferase involved in LPS biosynthesis